MLVPTRCRRRLLLWSGRCCAMARRAPAAGMLLGWLAGHHALPPHPPPPPLPRAFVLPRGAAGGGYEEHYASLHAIEVKRVALRGLLDEKDAITLQAKAATNERVAELDTEVSGRRCSLRTRAPARPPCLRRAHPPPCLRHGSWRASRRTFAPEATSRSGGGSRLATRWPQESTRLRTCGSCAASRNSSRSRRSTRSLTLKTPPKDTRCQRIISC